MNLNTHLLLNADRQPGRRHKSICLLNTTKQRLCCVDSAVHQRRETGEALQSLGYSFHAPIASWIRVLSSLWLISSWAGRSAAPLVRPCGWVWSWCPMLPQTTNGIQTWLRGVHLDRSCLHRACVCHHKLSSKHTQTTCACKHVQHICKSTSIDKRGNLASIIPHFTTIYRHKK